MNVINKIKTKNFIFASTGAAQDCSSAYGISKRAAEDVVREYCTVHNPIPYTTFRFYNVIGTDGFDPTNPDGLMYNLMKAPMTGSFTIYGKDYKESWDGTCVRDYVHVNEICTALKDAIETPANKIECLGHGVGYTVKEIVDMFQRVNNLDFDVKYGPRRKGDLPSSVLEDVSPYMKNLYTLEELLKI
jgi:UDP-glucose 4-epimerase